jgi:hypothetical protein
MKFQDLKLGDIFTVNNVKYKKVKPEKLTCCQLKCNAKQVANGANAVFKPQQEVQKVA